MTILVNSRPGGRLSQNDLLLRGVAVRSVTVALGESTDTWGMRASDTRTNEEPGARRNSNNPKQAACAEAQAADNFIRFAILAP
jgi:hypothetical protein